MELFEISWEVTGATLLLGICVLMFTLWCTVGRGNRKRQPPGPISLPFIGTMAFHGFSTKEFNRLNHKYGDIYSICVGSTNVVVLNSYDVMKEAIVTNAPACSGRGYGMVDLGTNPHKAGIVSAKYDQLFRESRAESMRVLRTLGFGKPVMEHRIQKEVDGLVHNFRLTNGTAFNPKECITLAIGNIIYGLLCNSEYDSGDSSEAQEIIGYIEEFFKMQSIFLLNYFPMLRILPWFAKPLTRIYNIHKQIMDFGRRKIQDHIESHTPGLDSDFLHAYLEIYMNKEKPERKLDMNNLEFIMRDLFMGGAETSSTSTQWLLLILANHPSIQAKAQNHVDTVIEKGGRICLADREKLPYIEAIMWEMQRYKTIAPIAHPHHVDADTTIAGFHIPKGTGMLLNVPRVHMNETTWSDPHIFRPERFIDSNGRFARHPHLIPFSMGKRQCPGEVLARQELFLFTATLLQRFTFSPPEGVEKLDERGNEGLTFIPRPFQIRAVAR